MTTHTAALEAAREAMQAVTLDGQRVRLSDEYADALVRAAIVAFLREVGVDDRTVAAVQRAEQWSSFWSPDDAAALGTAALRALADEIENRIPAP